jgi:hypothetical protein
VSGADQVSMLAAALLVGALLAWRARVERVFVYVAQRPALAMTLLAVLPVALRLALLANFPAPQPSVADDFSYLLLADTLRHGRLTNPPHAMAPFFETFFVLQQPTYSSIFPLGQGIVLAIGWILTGHPWTGVLLSAGALSALTYWMLCGWTTRNWALLGALYAAIQFGPLSQWTNSYWGGAVSAVAGCLVFGALPRWRADAPVRNGALLGLGLALQLLTRPYEFLLILAPLALYLAQPLAGSLRSRDRKGAVRSLATCAAFLASAAGLVIQHNHAVTGSWTTLPYQISRAQYGVPAAFTFQANPQPHRELTREQQLDYAAQAEVHGPGTDSLASYTWRLLERVRYYRFYFLVPLYLVLPFFLTTLGDTRFAWVALTLLTLALGANFYPYFYSHYIAVATCLFILVAIAGLERLTRLSQPAGQLVIAACLAHFLFWYGAHVFTAPVRQFETWDAINHGDPEGRIAVGDKLARAPGRQLVFVRYGPRHTFTEWVHNAADIDGARVVWARDLGSERNARLLASYPDRNAWLLEADALPPRLLPYARPATD